MSDLIADGIERATLRATRSHASHGTALRRFRPSGFDQAQEVFGIECRHHYGITTHNIIQGVPVGHTVYRLIREVWHAPKGSPYDVLDDNHTWDVHEAENPDWFSRVTLRKNERSPYFARIPGLAPALFDGPGEIWFSQEYRIATRGLIEREVADLLQWAERWQADAERQRDTIRGRKARGKYLSYASMKRREADLVRSRWPQFDGSTRTGWQERLHASAIEAGTAETAQTDSVHESAGPKGDAQPLGEP